MKKNDISSRFKIGNKYYVYLDNELLSRLEGSNLFFLGVGNTYKVRTVEKGRNGRYTLGMYYADTVPIALHWLLSLSDIRTHYRDQSQSLRKEGPAPKA